MNSAFCHELKQHKALARNMFLDFPASRAVSQNKPLFFTNCSVSVILLQQQVFKKQPQISYMKYPGKTSTLMFRNKETK
jgi:hypothetical protein